MRIGIVTDSCCDLPRSFLEEHNIVILPISIRSGSSTFVDTRDPAATQTFYRDTLSSGDHESIPFSAAQISELFLKQLVVDFDYVFCITVMSSRSAIHANAMKASLSILNSYRSIREGAGVKGPFSLRVFDSKTLFTGQGVLVAEVAKMVKREASTYDIIRHIDMITETSQAFLVPADLSQLRNQARSKGDSSVSFFSYALGTALDIKPILRCYHGETGPVGKVRGFEAGVAKLFDMTTKQIELTLAVPTVCVSYGGDLASVERMPGYAKMIDMAKRHNVEVYVSEMATTTAVNIGAGGLSIAFAAKEEAKFE
jgi:DegV family protein with EDD domain